jgi:hypothetical protein
MNNMDIIKIIREKIDQIENGTHLTGLRAVLVHIETATAHLQRGHDTPDETTFTDAIYRTNQAFEGSLKEAFRVLAEKDPEKKTPYQIEKYLIEKNVFRHRVLSQLANYRTEWRNPSTHDHKLDFDSSEAFLAIVSVCAFTILLLDQIAEKLAHDRSKAATDAENERLSELLKPYKNDLPLFVGHIIAQFMQEQRLKHEGPLMREAELLGSVTGFLESIEPDSSTTLGYQLAERGHERADILVKRGNELLLIEFKGMNYSESLLRAGLDQLDRYMDISGVLQGVLILGMDLQTAEISDLRTPFGRRVVVVGPDKIAT